MVDLLGRHQLEHALDQRPVALGGRREAQLGAHAVFEGVGEHGLVRLQRGHGDFLVADQRQECLRQAEQVPVGDVGLLVEGVAALGVAVVADVARVEAVEELERPVVDGEPEDAHVVGVHHPVAEAHGLPLGEQGGGAFAHGLEEGGVGVAVEARRGAAFGVVAVDDVVGQRAQLVFALVGGEVLEVAEADEAGRHAGHDGGAFGGLAVDGRVGAGHAQRARGRNAQAVHGLAAQELADARTQHGTAVAAARIGRAPRALELHFEPALGLAEQDRASVAQLPGPDAELVAAVDRGERPRARDRQAAGERGERGVRVAPAGRQAQLTRHGVAVADPVRVGQRRGAQFGEKGGAQRREAGLPAQAQVGDRGVFG
ncbi:hypothetical protein D9M68_507200 [compost metagenome]